MTHEKLTLQFFVFPFLGEKCKSYFTASVFAKLQQGDPQGRISIMALFNYVMRKTWLRQTRISKANIFLTANFNNKN